MESNRTYKFVRIRRKNSGEYGTWYFKPRTREDMELHWKEICGAQMRQHCRERFGGMTVAEGRDGRMGLHFPHPTTEFGMGVDAFVSVTNAMYVEGMLNVENEAYNSRMRSFERGEEIYLAEGMTVFCLDGRFCEIAEEVESEKFAYPTKKAWDLGDVRYMQWNMLGNVGTHWYAKVGNRDIVDRDGNMKWNTRAEAESAAKYFLETLA